MKRFFITLAAGLFIAAFVGGCSVEESSNEKLRDLEFTVVEEADVPEELQSIVDEKKQSEFKITYTDNESLYICVGYGEQQTGGYSIAVNDLYLTSNAIFVDTNLIGPSKEEKISEGMSYPYIVIKTEYMDKSVVFE
ncbi:protease complex subunit PrcB family protein [Konateibacter massiliensis]|uniref:protease complex subunit PrcB family protein n=1 Tax=Konateibacter massiliensis TaxID=2002841 RepID=UPI001F2C474D|nr:protease complex subunit PrcB family protein [Konateibacter massiliensis]